MSRCKEASQLSIRNPVQSTKSSPIQLSERLRLNVACDRQVRETLIAVGGIGHLTIDKILRERWLHGEFLDSKDFDTRIKGIRYASLTKRCMEYDVNISLHPSSSVRESTHGEPSLHEKHSFLANQDTESKSRQCQLSRKLHLNRASDREVRDTMITVSGIGQVSIDKILQEREENGDFLSRADFDRRITRRRYSFLEQRSKESGITLSLSPSSRRTAPAPLSKSYDSLNGTNQNFASGKRSKSVALATWNTGRMSLTGSRYMEKVSNLVRFIIDSEVQILCLQEVGEGVAEDLVHRFRGEFGTKWKTLRDYGRPRKTRQFQLVILHCCAYLNIQSILEKQALSLSLVRKFQRVPQVAFIAGKDNCRHLIALVHVHLWQADPRSELEKLPSFLEKVERYAQRRSEASVSLMLVGDFNLNSDSMAFDCLREFGMVELVRPEYKVEQTKESKVLHEATTIGGQWFDNIWVSTRQRDVISDGWCFDFGGRTRRLGQSAHEFASKKRSSCSDHLPVVAKFRSSLASSARVEDGRP